jgi:cytochrome c-type biogenesis protein CcmE
MHARVRNRLLLVLLSLVLVVTGVILLLRFLSDNLMFFITPSELNAQHVGKEIRIGGLVTIGSIQYLPNRTIIFVITDNSNRITVRYRGIIPPMFREGQGVVAEGELENLHDEFKATKLLTKHDENYKPPTQSLKNQHDK